MQFAPFRTGSALDAYYLGGLSTYWHVVLTAAISFQFLMYVSKWLSRRVVPNHYTALSLRKQYDWDSHFVAFCFSVYICTQALPLIFHPDLIKDKIWGYTPEAATVIATTCGYFLWDIFASLYLLPEHGWSMVGHAVCSFLVYLYGLGPFTLYYGAVFILFELSTPFLNIHWFLDKLKLTGSRIQLINGVVFLGVFFCVRIIWGFYMSISYFYDLSHDANVPYLHFVVYGISNSTLMALNVIWFTKIIAALRKRFPTGADSPSKKQSRKLRTK